MKICQFIYYYFYFYLFIISILLMGKKGQKKTTPKKPNHTHRHMRKEGNGLFNNALNTFYLWVYDVDLMANDYSDSERENPLPPHGLLFPIN